MIKVVIVSSIAIATVAAIAYWATRNVSDDTKYLSLQVASVASGLLAVAILAGTTFFGVKINRRDGLRVLSLEKARDEAKTALSAQEQRTNETALALAASQKELIELQERVKPRSLSGAASERLVKALRAAPEKGPVEVMYSTGDGEAAMYATQLRKALETAGWDTKPATQEFFAAVGTTIAVRSFPKAPAFAGALQKAFAEAGLPIDANETPELPRDVVAILVGTKP